MNKFENRFNRVPNDEEKKQLDLVVEEVLKLHLDNQGEPKLHSLRTEHETHFELLKQKKGERNIENLRNLIRLLAMDFFRENNRMPDSVDLFDRVNKEIEGDKEEQAA
jgi:hypothetical protein